MANLGIIFGSALSSGVDTYAKLQQIQQSAAAFQQQQNQWQREDQERQAAATPTNNTQTVTPGMLASQMAGADGKADPDAVMSTYGATQDPTQAPSQSAQIVQQGIAQGQQANVAAGQGPQGITVAQQQPVQRAPVPTVAGGAPASFNAPSGDNVTAATQYVRAQEGGYVANDNGKGPTNFGINGQANGLTPDQVKNLTPAQADAIYKQKYFSGANGGVDISKLPQPTAVAVADTAANMGQAKAAELFKQSGGDINKFLDLRQKAYDQIDASPATHQVWNNRMAAIREFVNQHGTPTDTTADTGATPMPPDAKVSLLHAEPIQASGIGQNVKFTHGEDGSLQMTKADSAADAIQRMATKAMQVGDLKNGPQLQAMAIQLRAQEAQQQVSSILTNDQISQDQKVAQLAKIAGAQAYKTENGQYIIPGLGPTDSSGNPLPMTAPMVGNLASSLATPDGLHHVIDTQLAMQKVMQGDRKTDIEQQNANTEQSKAAQSGALIGAETTLKKKQGDYYEANAGSANAAKDAQASERNAKAAIDQSLTDLQAQAQALDPTDPQYKMKMQHLTDQANLVKMRGGIGGSAAKEPNPIQMQDGQTRKYADGSVKTYVGQLGTEVPASDYPKVVAGLHELQTNPVAYTKSDGSPLVKPVQDQESGHWGFMLDPQVAAANGINPHTLYDTPQAAERAARSKARAASTSTPNPGAQIPQGIPTESAPYSATP